MNKFIGTKIVIAVAMTRAAYNEYRGWPLPADENGQDEGYLVEYQDGGKPNMAGHAGYVSWSPAEQFDAAYRPFGGMTFGLALEALKQGAKVARTGWNGKGLFVYLVPAAAYPVQTGAAKSFFGEGSVVPYNAYFALKQADDTVSTWAPSIGDALAEDWMVVETADKAVPTDLAPKQQEMSSDASIEQEIQAKGKTAPRVTPADLAANIASEHYFTAAEGVCGAAVAVIATDNDGRVTEKTPVEIPGGALALLTFCVLILRNGFTVMGESACASPENFDAEIGRKVALENAKQKIWPLMGYALKQELHEAK